MDIKHIFKRVRICWLVLLGLVLVLSCNKKPDESLNMPVKEPKIIKQPLVYYSWFDSLKSSLAKGAAIKLSSSNGLSDSYTFEWYEGCYYRSDEGSVYNIYADYTSSLYGNNFDIKFAYGELNGNLPIDSMCSKPYMEIYTLNSNYQYLADSTTSRFVIHNYMNGVSYVHYGWNYLGEYNLNGKIYHHVYNITNMLPGDYKSLLIDKHYGMLQFTDPKGVVWTVNMN